MDKPVVNLIGQPGKCRQGLIKMRELLRLIPRRGELRIALVLGLGWLGMASARAQGFPGIRKHLPFRTLSWAQTIYGCRDGTLRRVQHSANLIVKVTT
jgi:hypothetical protein